MMFVSPLDSSIDLDSANKNKNVAPDRAARRRPQRFRYRQARQTGTAAAAREPAKKPASNKNTRDAQDAREAARLVELAAVVTGAQQAYRVFDLYCAPDGTFSARPPSDTTMPDACEAFARHILHNDGHWEVLEPIPTPGKEEEEK